MTGHTTTRIGIPILLALLFLAALAVFVASEDAGAQDNPPSTGDWNVYTPTTLSNQRISLDGNLIVWSGGQLTLNSVDLVFTHQSFGGKSLRVRANGHLTMTKGTIQHSTQGSAYRFVVDSGGIVSLTGVSVMDLWHNPGTSSSGMEGGITIWSHQVALTNCTFLYNERVAVTIRNADPTITNCTFSKTAYWTFNKYSYNIYREAFGIVNIDGSPLIEECTFNGIGDYDTAFNDGTTYYYYNYLRLNGIGIYSVRGSPKIRDCIFEDTGRLPPSSSIYVYVENVGYVRFYMWNQEYRGAVTAVNPLLLEVTDCVFNGNYNGYYGNTDEGYCIYQSDGRSSIKGNLFNTSGGGVVGLFNGDMIMRDNVLRDFYYYGIFINGQGSITIHNNTINGTAETRAVRNEYGLYIYYGGGNVDIRDLNITFCARALWIYETTHVAIYDTVIANCSRKVYANSAQVDLYNVTVSRQDVELGYYSSEVNIYFKLSVYVTWQNSVPIPDAIIQIFNESNGLQTAKKADWKGLMPPLTMLQAKIMGTSQSHMSTVNSPLKISAFASGIESTLYTVPFDKNTFFQCIVVDIHPPNVEIHTPKRDHAQNTTTLAIAGIAVDVGSGLDGVDVSSDGGETWVRADGTLTWNITLELAEGLYDILVRGVDMAGSSNVYTIKNLTIDLTPPLLEITRPTKDFIYTNQTTVAVSGNIESGSKVYLNGEELPTSGGSFFTQLSNQQEGLNTYEIMAVDSVGNRNITLLRIHQDITPPILLVEHPSEEYVTNERVLEVSGLTEIDVVVTIEGLVVEVENGLFSQPMTLKEGVNLIRVKAEDLAKNQKQIALRVTYDITPPQVNMAYPQGDGSVNHSTVTVAGTVEPDTREVRVNQVPIPVRQSAFSKDFKLSEGDNLIMVEVTDLAGNSVLQTYSITLDTRPPIIRLESPEDGIYVRTDTVQVSGFIDVGSNLTIDGVEVTTSGGYFTYDAPVEETVPGEGPNVLTVLAVDEVGNEAVVEVRVFRDTKAPDFSLYMDDATTSKEFINITGAVVDAADIAAMSINDMPIQPNSDGYFEAYVPLEVGTNSFTVRAVDMAGNEHIETLTIERVPLKVSDTGFMGLGSSTWLVLILFLFVGLAMGMTVLYLMKRREGVDE